MTGPIAVFLALIVFWLLSEIALIVKTRSATAVGPAERGSVHLIWIVLSASATAGMATLFIGVLPLPLSRPASWIAADALIALGLAVRWLAIATLGRFFSVDVAIQDEHRIVDRGLYRWVRHLAYTGLLVSFLGLGLAFGNWLGLVLATIPPAAVLLQRIRVEEAALLAELGGPYRDYCARTKQLVPGLY